MSTAGDAVAAEQPGELCKALELARQLVNRRIKVDTRYTSVPTEC